MTSDDTVTSHPIVVDVKQPSEITSVFDTISYSKVWKENMKSLLGFAVC